MLSKKELNARIAQKRAERKRLLAEISEIEARKARMPRTKTKPKRKG